MFHTGRSLEGSGACGGLVDGLRATVGGSDDGAEGGRREGQRERVGAEKVGQDLPAMLRGTKRWREREREREMKERERAMVG